MSTEPATTQTNEQAWRSLRDELAVYTEELFEYHQVEPRKSGTKVVRDSIHGYFLLQPWEVEVVDSPIIQRLRYIHQTALAYQVYPSAHHTRLEHSLGAAKLISDLAEAKRRDPSWEGLLGIDVENELRLAALLHDVGHCLFSHLSETIISEQFFGQVHQVKSLLRFRGRDIGEILSHGLLMTPTVQAFLTKIITKYGLKNVDPKRISSYCIGYPQSSKPDAYKADLISGPLDVDKLDYLQRDTYFTGIKSDIDVQHIIRSMTIHEEGGVRRIAASMSGVSGVEQLHFARMLLFPAIYQHQKVRSLEATVRGIFEMIRKDPCLVPDEISHLRFSTISDFFRASEFEFFSLSRLDTRLGRSVKKLINRNVMRRALHISMTALDLEGRKDTGRYDDFVHIGDDTPDKFSERDDLRRMIFMAIPAKYRTDISRLWVDVPKMPTASKDILRCKVIDIQGNAVDLTSVFPIDGWLNTYGENKWNAHVFYEPVVEYQQAAAYASNEVLSEQYDIKFNDSAFIKAKVKPPGPASG